MLLACLLGFAHAQQVFIWVTTSDLGVPTNVTAMNAACNAERTGGIALVCTPNANVASFFSNAMTLKNTMGAQLTLAASPSTLNKTFISYWDSTLVLTDGSIIPVATQATASGCDRAGHFLPNGNCGGWTNPLLLELAQGDPSNTAKWLHAATPLANCNTRFRVNCAQGPLLGSASDPTPSPTTTGPTTTRPTTTQPTAIPSTAVPTAFPTKLPTVIAGPTASPTTTAIATPTTTGPTTNMPSTSGPTTSTPTTSGPTTSMPTTTAPTTRVPTTAMPTTKQPTTPEPSVCASCTVTLHPTGAPSQTVNVGSPTTRVTVTVPASIFQNNSTNTSNTTITVVIVVAPTNTAPPSPRIFGSESLVSIDIQDNGMTREGSVLLPDPIHFLMPYSVDALLCSGQGPPPQCVWWNGSTWRSEGCLSASVAEGTWCTCFHLTDFAVLLDQSDSNTCRQKQSTDVYYPFIVFYALLCFYCIVVLAVLAKKRTAKDTNSFLILQHALIGMVALLRILSSLTFLKAFKADVIFTAFLHAAPYPLEYWLFTRLASTWAGLVHYSLLTNTARWAKIRPVFWTINIIGTLMAVGLFVIFQLDESFEAAVAGTSVQAFLYLAMAIVFNVYANKLSGELDGSSKSGSSSTLRKKSSHCGVAGKIKWIGRVASISFGIQALSSVFGLSEDPSQLTFWTALFLLSNVCALTCLATVYFAALSKAVGMSTRTLVPPKADNSSNSNKNLIVDRGSGVDLETLSKHEGRGVPAVEDNAL